MKLVMIAATLISLNVNAAEVKRTLDYKTHKIVCTARSNEVVTETITRSGEFRRTYRRGHFFKDRFVSDWATLARREDMREYMHVRESIPNVTLTVDGVLIIWSASHTLMRAGRYSESLRHLTEDVCGPFDQH